jgi:hypothetical protein
MISITLHYFQLILYRHEPFLLGKLEELHDLIDKEDGEQAKALQVHDWHDGEFISVSNQEKEDIIESLDFIQSMLREEMQILLKINGSSDNSAVKDALLALRNTEGFLSEYPPMKRFGGTFKEIVSLSDRDAQYLLGKFLRYSSEIILILFY